MRIKTKAKQLKKALTIALNGSSRTVDRVQIKADSTGANVRTVLGTRVVVARFLVDEKDEEEAVWVESGLLDAVKNVADDNDVELSAGETGLVRVEAGSAKFNLGRYTVPESVDLPTAQNAVSTTFETKRFVEAVGRVAFACDTDNSHYALGGTFFAFDGTNVNLVSTDGRRLVWETLEPRRDDEKRDEFSFIAPADALFALIKTLKLDSYESVSLVFNRDLGSAIFQTPSFTFRVELIDGRFPAWRSIVGNASATPICYDAKDAEQALNTLKILGCTAAVFDCLEQSVVVSGRSEGMTEATAEIRIPALCPANAGNKVKLDIKYALDFLKRVDGMVYHGIDRDKPNSLGIAKYVDKEHKEVAEKCEAYTCVIMPQTGV